ncbi:N-acetyltransferase [Allofranklinella schreckenbergeri]|uniref:N-acetyltransferase n=1 Tax=Allofranklinella schreckenbergeri TaxID=1076744 RepID=A0A3M6QVV2_9BURK|nr:GNAT family N-acetyltransferase [Allofranklinella schreckenbergeri]RMW99038.1 N-acetyltransferase [Allofranklinella schreckenbergeri]RMX07157.1 N-acetyltransferase [Allofranklinella schreckenbergeri]
MPSVRKNEAAQRYEVLLDDGTVAGFADYEIRGNQVVLPHTVVQPEYNGQGLASLLAQAALEDIQAAGRCVVPACSFIEAYLQRKPQWQSLRCPV